MRLEKIDHFNELTGRRYDFTVEAAGRPETAAQFLIDASIEIGRRVFRQADFVTLPVLAVIHRRGGYLCVVNSSSHCVLFETCQ
ncbi:hypothetical protein hrd7_30170 [Leptolinea sp. HRD-7]|nr:hypothetical protein hrd7_30170 [Leptolinea sp. HRD-7]